ncbi:MAG: hypothetical protein HC896_13945 [Bacteroidales bacterium]|nr:hypothetical protein [Bacteroidales bacterium]
MYIKYLAYLRTPMVSKDTLFNYLEENNMSYALVFSQLDTIKSVGQSYAAKIRGVFNQIDDFCEEHQQVLEEFMALKAKINQLAEIRILALRDTKWDVYKDVKEIKVRVYNKTHETIRFITFNLRITSTDTNFTAIIPCKVELPISSFRDQSFIFDERAHANYHNQLSKIKYQRYKYSYQIKDIYYGDNKLTLHKKEFEEVFSENFTSPLITANPSPYCPYLESGDSLIVALESLNPTTRSRN